MKVLSFCSVISTANLAKAKIIYLLQVKIWKCGKIFVILQRFWKSSPGEDLCIERNYAVAHILLTNRELISEGCTRHLLASRCGLFVVTFLGRVPKTMALSAKTAACTFFIRKKCQSYGIWYRLRINKSMYA